MRTTYGDRRAGVVTVDWESTAEALFVTVRNVRCSHTDNTDTIYIDSTHV